MSQTWAVLAGIEFAALAVVTAWLVRFFAIPGSPRLALVTVFVSWCVRGGCVLPPPRAAAAAQQPGALLLRARPRRLALRALQVFGLLRHAFSAH
jgi:hypothetical protein